MQNKQKILLNPAAESGGGSPKPEATKTEPAAPAQATPGTVTIVPVGEGGQVQIPGEEIRGKDGLIGKEEDTLSMDDIGEEAFVDPKIVDSPAKEEAAKQAAAAEAQKKSDEEARAAQLTEEQKQTAAQKVQQQIQQQQQKSQFDPHPDAARQPRDYTGFEQGDAEALRAAPNNVFNFMKTRLPALYKEAQEYRSKYDELLKSGGLPQNYFEHPGTFKLTREFQQKEVLFQQMEYEEAFYARQLEQLRGGAKKVQSIHSFDAKGNPVVTDIMIDENNAKTMEDRLVRALGVLGEKKSGVAADVQEMEKKFTEQQGALVNVVREGTKKYFPFYEPDHPNYTKDIGEGIEKIKAALPPQLRGSILSDALAKSYYLNLELSAKIKELMSSAPSAPSNVHGKPKPAAATDQRSTDSQVVDASGSGGAGGDEMLRMSDLEEPGV